MKMMLLSSVVAVSVATAAVMFFLAYSESDAEEPDWIVTGVSFALPVSERMSLGVEYTAPGGRTGRWEFSADPKALGESSLFECWGKVIIGSAIPECIRSSEPPR